MISASSLLPPVQSDPCSPVYTNQFLQAAQFVVGFVAEDDRPVRFGDFGDVNVTARIGRNAVRCDELAETFAHWLCAEVGEDLAFFRINYRHPWTEVGHTACQGSGGLRTEFADDAERTCAARHEKTARPRKVVPLAMVLAVAVEHLHPV